MAKFVVNRDVTPSECRWLDATVKAGTVVYRYMGFTYGCVGSGMAVTVVDGETPFFEMPRDSLTAESHHPHTAEKVTQGGKSE